MKYDDIRVGELVPAFRRVHDSSNFEIGRIYSHSVSGHYFHPSDYYKPSDTQRINIEAEVAKLNSRKE